MRRIAFLSAVVGLVLAGTLARPAAGKQAEGTRPYWVFFRDRGPQGQALAGDAARCLEIAQRVPRDAWARRTKAAGPRGGAVLPDERDLPLWEPYVLAAARSGRVRERSRWLNAISMDLAAARVGEVAALACVREVRPVAIARPASLGPEFDASGQPLETALDVRRQAGRGEAEFAYGSLPYGAAQWQLEEIGVPGLHALGYSGNRLRFMMIDTGFMKSHDAFAQTLLLDEWDFLRNDGNVQNEPDDLPIQHNHGTSTWSAAGGYAPGALIGPAYGASFLLAKTEDVGVEVRAEEDHYVAALEWADAQGVALTSASLSYVCFDDDFCYLFPDKDGDTAVISIAIDIAASRGILCVNSQGNYGCSTGSLGTPADADSVIAVGAVDSLNQIASFSACGPAFDGRIKPEVLARGVHTEVASPNADDAYGYGSGTSFSAPLVAGAAALLLEAHPEWGPAEVRAALMATADRADVPDSQYGWGRIDALQALTFTPVLHPRPFSLAAPSDSAVTAFVRPRFTWRRSVDPDPEEAILYTLHIQDTGDPQQHWSVAAGGDTSLVLPFHLALDRSYRWWVAGEDPQGHERLSREEFLLFVQLDPSSLADAADDGEPDEATALPGASLRLRCAPNPFRSSLRFLVEEASTTRPALRAGEVGTKAEWSIHDPLGRRIAAGPALRGETGFSGEWNGRTVAGARACPGIYYLEVRLGYRVLRETIVRLPAGERES